MGEALAAGDSLIIFPEGARNLGDALLPFKSGPAYTFLLLKVEVMPP
ncbi:MAG: 1-acyl-sn-glycerol-3-phosphate acyltransferase [Thiobacillus sp.]|nr:1-acyl-sn-glycerol-3-phosphate acyltransferase [Thiobacillus sp.]